MTELNDHELLAEFARSGSEPAFAELVARHVNLVYSAARRFCGDAQHCEEITQAVFIILARKAGKLSPRVVLSGWLYQTARLTAANFVKGEIRRQQREQEAYMQSTLNETDAAAWEQLAPLLDEAMGRLGETDRNAVVLRFFENKTAAETAAALKLTEAAAHKRVNRALEKLRKLFSKRGVTLSATLIAGAVSTGSVQAAPVGLATTISTMAITKGAVAGGSTMALVEGALKIMAWTKAKTAIVVGACVVIAAGTASVGVNEYAKHRHSAEWNFTFASGDTIHVQNRNGDALEDIHLAMKAHGEDWEFDATSGTISDEPDDMVRIVLDDVQAHLGSKGSKHSTQMTFRFKKTFRFNETQPKEVLITNLPQFVFDVGDLASPAAIGTNKFGMFTVGFKLSKSKADELREFTQKYLHQQVEILFGSKTLCKPTIASVISNGGVEQSFASSESNEAREVIEVLNRR